MKPDAISEIEELLESTPGIKSAIIDPTEVTLELTCGTKLTFRAEGYEGTHLEIDAELVVKKSVRL